MEMSFLSNIKFHTAKKLNFYFIAITTIVLSQSTLSFENKIDLNTKASSPFIVTNKLNSQSVAYMGTYASLSEVCELLNHEIFYSVELPNEEFVAEQVLYKFYSKKILEVPIDPVIEKFQSKLPYYQNFNEFVVGESMTDHVEFQRSLSRTFTPKGTYSIGKVLSGENCLPKVVRISMSMSEFGYTQTRSIEWWSNNSNYRARGSQYKLYISSVDVCLFCIFFIKEFHEDLKNIFDQLLENEKILQKELLIEAKNLGIRDVESNSLENQSFNLAKEIDSIKRKKILEEWVHKIKEVEDDYNELIEVLLMDPSLNYRNSSVNTYFSSEDYLIEKLFNKKLEEYRKLYESFTSKINVAKIEIADIERKQVLRLEKINEKRLEEEANQEKQRLSYLEEQIRLIDYEETNRFRFLFALLILFLMIINEIFRHNAILVAAGLVMGSAFHPVRIVKGFFLIPIDFFRQKINRFFREEETSSKTSSKDENFYELLDIGVNATAEEIEKAYQRNALMYKPIENTSEEAREKFSKIKKAYNTLRNPIKKYFYDKKVKS